MAERGAAAEDSSSGWAATWKHVGVTNGWGDSGDRAGSAAPETAKAVRSLLGVADDVVIAVAQACLARGAGHAELVAQLGACLDADDAERLASLLTGGRASPPEPQCAELHMPTPVWAVAELPDARLTIACLRSRLRLLGISTQGMTERSELESTHRRAMWPPPEPSPEPEVQALGELHRQLLRLALYLTPDRDERLARDALSLQVTALAHRVCPAEPLAQRYGSEALGLAAFTSDIDMCIAVSGSRSRRSATLRWIGAALRQTSWASRVDVRENARVPIINFTDRSSGLEVDLSLERCETTELVEMLCSDYTALEPLAIVLKVLLQQADLNTPYTGGIGSFKLYVLIGHYLSCRDQDGEPWASGSPLGAGALGALMIGVLRHAASHFDWRHTFTFAGGLQVDFSSVYRSDLIVDYCAELAEQLQKEVDQETARLRREDATVEPQPWRGLMRVVEASRLCAKRETARLAVASQAETGAVQRAEALELNPTIAARMAGKERDDGAAAVGAGLNGDAAESIAGADTAHNHQAADSESDGEWELAPHTHSKSRHSSKRSQKKQRKREKRKQRQDDRRHKRARVQVDSTGAENLSARDREAQLSGQAGQNPPDAGQ